MVERKGELAVVEYTELSSSDRYARDRGGTLAFGQANSGLFMLETSWIEELHHAKKWDTMSLHAVFKPISPTGPSAWKFEYFFFDILPWAVRKLVVLYPREQTFAPLKQREGPNGIAAVQAALLRKARQEV